MAMLKHNMPNHRLVHYSFGNALPPKPTEAEVMFHRVEEGKLLILGSDDAVMEDGVLYIDCGKSNTGFVEWVYPEQNEDVLTLVQVNDAIQNGDVLEIK